MVWLGIDLGNARVGLALSDPELSLAYPAGNIRVYGDSLQALDEVVAIVEERAIDHIVIGLPLRMDGKQGASAKKARIWANQLRRYLEEEVCDPQSGIMEMPRLSLMDERLTTVDSHRMLCDANVNSRSHRSKVDQQSAVVILQTALDQRDRQVR